MSGKRHGLGAHPARQAAKDAARIRRNKGKVPSWMDGERRAEAMKLITRSGNGGTDKSGSRKRSIVYYSDKPASK